MGSWRIANRTKPDGALPDAPGFYSVAALLQARRVSVPTEVDARRAMENAGGLASGRTRALEFWWDATRQKMDVVLVAACDDMPAYEQDFMSVYVNATFEDCPLHPKWYDRAYYVEAAALECERRRKRGGGGGAAAAAAAAAAAVAAVPAHASGDTGAGVGGVISSSSNNNNGSGSSSGPHNRRLHAPGLQCSVFDLGYMHGHLQVAFDVHSKHDTITQVSSVMQLARYAWLQMVFCKNSFTRELQGLSASMRSKYAEFSESKHVPMTDGLLGGGGVGNAARPRDHPEKKGDFVAHYAELTSHLAQKMQDEHVMISVRGLLESEHPVDLDWSGISAAPAQGRSIEHLTSNSYEYADFVGLRRRKDRAVGRGWRGLRGRGGARAGAVDPVDPGTAARAAAAAVAGMWEPHAGMRVDGQKTPDTRLRIFEDRLLPCASGMRRPISKYLARSIILGRYGTRRSPPFILMTVPELGLLLRLPDTDATPNLTITRQQVMPQQPQHAKSGFCLGFFERARSIRCSGGLSAAAAPEAAATATAAAAMASATGTAGTAKKPDPMFGAPDTNASSAQGVVLSTQDIPTHAYLCGGTKSGKTTLIRCIAKHMELANIRGTYPNAFIFVDPKGSDSYDFLRQCEPESYAAGRVTFLDPIETKFSINVLELPPYAGPEERQVVVSQYVGYIMQMIEYWYQGSDAFVRLKRILDTLLQYVYLKNDKPTFLDIYDIIVSMQRDGEEMLVRMYKELGMPEDVLKQAIQSVATMRSEAYEPALNRLEKFATDPILRHMFCVRESTIRFDRLIAPGSFVVIRLSPLSIPQHIITLTKQTLVVKLWFAIQERAARVRLESDRTQVLLALDEFQDLAGLPVIEAMLTQARSYGLGLLLAHQSTAQLDDGMLEIILGNAGTQFVGRVSGRDAGRFGDAWDPAYARELKAQLATQEYHHWTARMIAGGGESQPLPVQFWPVYVPPRRMPEPFITEFISGQKAMYGGGEAGESMMRRAESRSSRWLLHVPYEPPSRDEWHIMCILGEAGTPLMLRQIVARLGDGTTASDAVSGILRRMCKKKLLRADGRKYVLPHDMLGKYMVFDPSAIGRSEDIPLAMGRAVRYYLSRRFFLCTAVQTVKRGKLRTDLVAYDYDRAEPISVEIESAAEVRRHPEHVKLNMTKWAELGFESCHVWSTHDGIRGIRDSLAEKHKKHVLAFVVDDTGQGGDGGDGAGSPGVVRNGSDNAAAATAAATARQPGDRGANAQLSLEAWGVGADNDGNNDAPEA